MAEHGERVRILAVARRQELDLVAVGERLPQILNAAVDTHEDGLLGKLRADRARGVEATRVGGKFEFGVVGKNDLHDRTGQGYAPP